MAHNGTDPLLSSGHLCFDEATGKPQYDEATGKLVIESDTPIFWTYNDWVRQLKVYAPGLIRPGAMPIGQPRISINGKGYIDYSYPGTLTYEASAFTWFRSKDTDWDGVPPYTRWKYEEFEMWLRPDPPAPYPPGPLLIVRPQNWDCKLRYVYEFHRFIPDPDDPGYGEWVVEERTESIEGDTLFITPVLMEGDPGGGDFARWEPRGTFSTSYGDITFGSNAWTFP